MAKRKLSTWLVFVPTIIICTLLVGCSSDTSMIDPTDSVEPTSKNSALSIDKDDCAFQEISPIKQSEKIAEFSGNNTDSQNISLETDGSIRIYWKQTSTESFLLTLTNLDPSLVNDPSRIVIIESITSPSSGCSDIPMDKGEYEINVESSNGSWVLEMDTVEYIH